jgi:hypothetical protein
MIRRMVVRPDKVMVSEQGEEILVVSRDAMREAMLDLESQLAFSGGVAAITVQRVPTGVPGEMVTNAALLEWKDAPVARPKAEQPLAHWDEVLEEPAATSEAVPELTQDELDQHFPDGDDDDEPAVLVDPETGEPEEDLAAIPSDKRALVR